MCVLAGNGSQLPRIPILTTATNSTQKQPPAGPVLDTPDLPGHAQHLPSKVQDEQSWAAHGQAPACLLCRLRSGGHLTAKIYAQTVSSIKTRAAVGVGGAAGELGRARDASKVWWERETQKGEREGAEAVAGRRAAPIAFLWEGEQRIKC